jgi:uncharacterized membrane protein YccC
LKSANIRLAISVSSDTRHAVSRLQRLDPGLFSLKRAARAAIVMPAVFAFADKVIKNPQTATFAAFGSFAILVFADFGGSRRIRLVAYLSLAGAGAVFIVLGTLCSRDPWIAAVAMAAVGFVVLYSAVISAYFVAGGTAAMLAFVLPVNVPADPSVIPARLAGWGLASAVGISAVMLLWPSQPRDKLRVGIARACGALADLLECELAGDRSLVAERARAVREAIGTLGREFLAAPYRPTGPTDSAAGIAFLVDELDWFQSLIFAPGESEARLDLCHDENREVLAAAVAVLRESWAILDGREGAPDLARLARARGAVADAVTRRIAELPPEGDELELSAALEPSFRTRGLSYSAEQIGRHALRATGGAEPADTDEAIAARWYRPATLEASAAHATAALEETGRRAAEQASPRSVLFRNSLRGAVALAVSVFVAQNLGVQHAFWVVLGTLSVLRSSALGTGATIVSALAGTAVGIVVGAGLIIAIGTNEAVAWAVLPFAVLLAAYAPRVISFAAGQAGFTVVVLMLFNLIQPSGWQVGLVRAEDVAIGFAVSIAVGVLFWPRGAAALLRDNLATTYVRAAEYLAATVHRLAGAGDPALAEQAAKAAGVTARRLDDGFRQYLGERSAKRMNMDSIAKLVAGARRVQRTSLSLLLLTRRTDASALGDSCTRSVDPEVQALQRWYAGLGAAVLGQSAPPPQDQPDTRGRRRVLECAHDAVSAGDDARIRAALSLLWASQHLENLWRLEAHLAPPAAEAARVSAR